jgi:uncharacterized membrane protein
MTQWDRFTIRAVTVAVAMSAACLGVLGARLAISGEDTYAFLAWNLFLAWIPFVVASALPLARGRAWLAVPVFASWLLFFPNAPYLVTDLVHIPGRAPGSPAIDWAMFPAFALTGLLIGAISLHLVHRALARRHGPRIAALALGVCIALAGFGMYLGRVLQWNSWDMVTRPGSRVAALADRFADPLAVTGALVVSVGSAACIAAAYLAYRAVADRSSGTRS